MDITTTDRDGVAVVTFGDGRMNPFTHDGCAALAKVIEDTADATAVVLTGAGEKAFSAGLDLNVVKAGDPIAIRDLVVALGEVAMKLWLHPRPTVGAINGHALAGGAVLTLACDHAIAVDEGATIGLTETQVGLPLPQFVIELAKVNLRNDRIEDLLLPGIGLDPAGARDAGFVDELAPRAEVLDRAVAKAAELGALPRPAYAETKRRLRGDVAERMIAQGVADIDAIVTIFLG